MYHREDYLFKATRFLSRSIPLHSDQLQRDRACPPASGESEVAEAPPGKILHPLHGQGAFDFFPQDPAA